jgi:hypothetical protein
MRRITFYFILGLGLAATIGTVYSQAAIEGRVQLPKPAADRGLNQRYQPSAEIAIGPVGPRLSF